ncbi:Protein DENND6A [Sciurus carolinensis]|uniref:Protein DENND6A n=1 Tax=Sciurus carolinensis TaxID=30640 RepID=A0AA41NF81_SCICA|nr:Protein DENND6A [Sciurus carolinensis]
MGAMVTVISTVVPSGSAYHKGALRRGQSPREAAKRHLQVRAGSGRPTRNWAPRVTWPVAPPPPSGSQAAAVAAAARALSRARSAAPSAVEAARTAKGRRMALRGPAGLGPGSRGPLDEAVAAAEGCEAPALVAAGATLEDDEEDDGRGRGLLRWDGFSAWLHCVCVVGFDLELGQAVEVIYPQHSKLTDKEKDPAYFYGYVYFRQVRDKTLKRGYFQKSLVLISKLPYIHFFHTVLKQIAPEYFEKNEPYLEAVFLHSQMLWELVLLGEPLVVMAPSPSESSETVLALVNCISPLKYFSDFRPYFTIHDSEFKEYTTRTQAPPSVILGVTNPFFAKTLQHWPHIIRIGDLKPADTRIWVLIISSFKGVQQKRPSEAQSVILRRYFLELTQSFIIPLERYVASLMPLQKSISPWKSPPQLRQFLPEEFMKTLEKTGPQLTSRIKGDWIGLYRHFLKSPNFDGWFKTRRKEMTQKLEALHLEALCEEDLLLWIQKHTEVEIVDLVLKLKNKLLQADREHLPVKPDTLEKLRTHIDAIILALPEDLQGILLKTGMT